MSKGWIPRPIHTTIPSKPTRDPLSSSNEQVNEREEKCNKSSSVTARKHTGASIFSFSTLSNSGEVSWWRTGIYRGTSRSSPSKTVAGPPSHRIPVLENSITAQYHFHRHTSPISSTPVPLINRKKCPPSPPTSPPHRHPLPPLNSQPPCHASHHHHCHHRPSLVKPCAPND